MRWQDPFAVADAIAEAICWLTLGVVVLVLVRACL
jgi:hypothetical protein